MVRGGAKLQRKTRKHRKPIERVKRPAEAGSIIAAFVAAFTGLNVDFPGSSQTEFVALLGAVAIVPLLVSPIVDAVRERKEAAQNMEDLVERGIDALEQIADGEDPRQDEQDAETKEGKQPGLDNGKAAASEHKEESLVRLLVKEFGPIIRTTLERSEIERLDHHRGPVDETTEQGTKVKGPRKKAPLEGNGGRPKHTVVKKSRS